MEVLFPTIFLVLLGFVLLLNVITLPANWIMLGLTALEVCLSLPRRHGRFFLRHACRPCPIWGGHRVHRARLGEQEIRFEHQRHVGGPAWARLSALWRGFPCCLALARSSARSWGAWIGCYLMERYKGRNDYEARQAAKGALVGRFLGIVVKCGIGAVMLGLTCHAIFQVPVYPEVTTF